MKQKIKIPIKAKIITKKDIEDIAEYLYTLKEKEDDYFNISIKFNNEIEISSNDLSCLNSRKIEEYEINQLRITYRNMKYTDEIDVSINNFDEFKFSNIEISSDNEQRLGSVEHKLKELLGFCKSQSKINYIFKYNSMLVAFISSAIAVLWTLSLTKFLKNYTEDYYILIAFILLFDILYYYFFNKLFKAYPNIEIDINDKTNRPKKRRKLFGGILTLIIIPLLLNIGYDVVKILFNM